MKANRTEPTKNRILSRLGGKLRIDDLHEFGERRELAVVEPEPTEQLPDAFNRIELWTVRRKKEQDEIWTLGAASNRLSGSMRRGVSINHLLLYFSCPLLAFRSIAPTALAQNDSQFPTGMERKTQPFYDHRTDGRAGRSVTLTLQGAKPDKNAIVETECIGRSEKTLFEKLKGVSQLSALLPPEVMAASECSPRIVLHVGKRVLDTPFTVPAKRHWTVYI